MSTSMVKANGAAVAPQPQTISAETMELVLGKGDLSGLSSHQRVEYLTAVCKSLGLNPLTQPFSIQKLGDKTVLYARRDATDQLRQVWGVTTQVVSRETVDDLIVVTVRATDRNGRSDEAIGAVPRGQLKGEALANAMMKCETKAKRRATLSLCGLGIVDETEVETVQDLERPAVKAELVAQKPWRTRNEMLAAMDAQRQRVGDEAFYRVLADDNMEEADRIQNSAQALRIYTALTLLPAVEVQQ